MRAIPGQEKIEGVLRACEDQTANYDWYNHLRAVASQLRLDFEDMTHTIHPAVFRGMTLLLPYVQSLPEDREILAQTNEGVCFLIVWAHHVLGFTVIMRGFADLSSGTERAETVFQGKTPAILVIDPKNRSALDSTVSLLERSTGERLLSIVPEPDEDREISSMVKRPVLGYGMAMLDSCWTSFVGPLHAHEGRSACLHEITLVTIALACRMSRYIYKFNRPFNRRTDQIEQPSTLLAWDEEDQDIGCTTAESQSTEDDSIESDDHLTDDYNRCDISQTSIVAAAKLLFDYKKPPGKELVPYIDAHTGVPTQEIPVPSRVAAACGQYGHDLHLWSLRILRTVSEVAVLIVLFAHATDLEDGSALLIKASLDCIRDQSIVTQIWAWAGDKPLLIDEDTWFGLISALLTGKSSSQDTLHGADLPSLVSDRGWTVHLPTFGDPDPATVGMLTASREKNFDYRCN